MKYINIVVRIAFMTIILVFTLMAVANKAWSATILLVISMFMIMAATLKIISGKHLSRKVKGRVTILSVILFSTSLVLLISDKKTSIYRSDDLKKDAYLLYDEQMRKWPGDFKDIYLNTRYGKVHLIASGPKDAPPIMLLHAAAMSGFSWADNVRDLIGLYRIYAVDNIGEIGKSELTNVEVFPKNGKELADHYKMIMQELGIDSIFILGASNGGFIASNLAYFYPGQVKGLILFGPQGLTPLTQKSIFMMSVGSLFPFSFVRDKVIRWAIGNDPRVLEVAGEWFDMVIKGTIPSLAHPVQMMPWMKKEMKMPILLFLGSKDNIVGNAAVAESAAGDYPNIEIKILESGHLIQIEKQEDVNVLTFEFLQQFYSPVNSNLKQKQ